MKISRRAALIAGGTGVAVAGAGVGVYDVATCDGPEPAAPPLMDGQGHLVWRNWSGIRHSYPAERAAPSSDEELAKILREGPAPIRAVGAGHSFMPLVPTDGTLLTLDNMSGLIAVDGDEVAVRAGTRLGDLGPALASHGRAMANLPDINKQSLGGALATATHGTGKHLRALHGTVTALRLVTPSGRVIDCDATKEKDLFDAARVSLGALGIVSHVKLKTIANRRLHRRVWLEPFEETLAQAETRWNTHRNYEFYAVPFTGLAANVTHDETDEAPSPRGPETDSQFLEALKVLRNLFEFSTPVRKRVAKFVLTLAEPKAEEAVDEGWKLLSTERPVRFNEMEFHVPADVQLAALREVVAAIETHRPDVFFPIELRRIAPDDAWRSPFGEVAIDGAWLSPFQDGEKGSIAVHCYYKDEYEFLFTLIEPILRRHGGRPHWGKLNSLKGADFAQLYPRWKDFCAMRRSLDPEGRMLNPYLKGLFGV